MRDVERWMDERCGPGGEADLGELYRDYLAWSKANGFPFPTGLTGLSRGIRAIMGERVKAKRRRTGAGTGRRYFGIHLGGPGPGWLPTRTPAKMTLEERITRLEALEFHRGNPE